MARLGSTKLGLWKRIKRLALTDVGALVRGLNQADLEAMEQLLIEADFGVPATLDLVEALEREVRSGRAKNESQLREALASRLEALPRADGDPGAIARPASGPAVVVVVGVNGAGKTTTVAKLAHRLKRQGRKPLLGAA